MKELADILALWSQVEANGESAVLATVVKTSGSSYRLPGARLLVTRTGRRAGSVSGGCLEQELVTKAWWLTENGPIVRRYDTTPEGEIATEYGLGCNGIIHVSLERMEPGRAEILDLIRQVRETRQAAVVEHAVAPGEVFTETLAPPLRLLIFGAGDDAVPLVTQAKFLGWEVFVFDGRAHYSRREKFPDADHVAVRTPGGNRPPLPVDEWTAAVLMSHSYSQDLAMIKELANTKLLYLGALGPRKRTLQMLSDAGMDAAINRNPVLHAPIGLDIGADGPEQVALAVVAEIQATLNRRSGGPLRDRAGSIHAPEGQASSDATNAWVHSIVCA